MNEEPELDDGGGDEAADRPFDAGEQHGVETRRQRILRLRRLRDAALGGLLELRPGRALVWELLSRSHLFAASVVPGEPPEMTAFREGERNVGLMLLADVMRVEPKAWERMQREAADDAAEVNRRPPRKAA